MEMFCRNCGKELPNDANFCSFCGTRQKTKESVLFKDRFMKIVNKHKTITFSYLGWVLIHISLFLFSKPKGFRYVGGFYESSPHRVDYDKSDGFYPFEDSILDIFQGSNIHCDFFDNIDVYDSSEFFFYVILLPIIIWVLVKGCSFFILSIRTTIQRRMFRNV